MSLQRPGVTEAARPEVTVKVMERTLRVTDQHGTFEATFEACAALLAGLRDGATISYRDGRTVDARRHGEDGLLFTERRREGWSLAEGAMRP